MFQSVLCGMRQKKGHSDTSSLVSGALTEWLNKSWRLFSQQRWLREPGRPEFRYTGVWGWGTFCATLLLREMRFYFVNLLQIYLWNILLWAVSHVGQILMCGWKTCLCSVVVTHLSCAIKTNYGWYLQFVQLEKWKMQHGSYNFIRKYMQILYAHICQQ